MVIPAKPRNEEARRRILGEYNILNTAAEKDFDDIVKLAAHACDMPISLLCLISEDKSWFKAQYGIKFQETAREYSFCAHAILSPYEILSVENAHEDPRFHDNPLVNGYPNVVSYVGIPIINPEGYALGVLCVIDNKPRKIDASSLKTLHTLAHQAGRLLEFRRTINKLNEKSHQLKQTNDNLSQFARIVSHDLKAPLNNILGLAALLKVAVEEKNDDDTVQIIDYINTSALKLKTLIDNVLNYSKQAEPLRRKLDTFNAVEVIDDALSILNIPRHFWISLPKHNPVITTSKVVFHQIMLNLLANAIKYNNKERGIIGVSIEECEKEFKISVNDNGAGIRRDEQTKIFELFETSTTNLLDKGTGVGLHTVAKLVNDLNGRIAVKSEPGVGSTFTFYLPKH